MRIHHKLFIAFFLVSALLVAGMSWLIEWSADRGMLQYVNTREAARLQPAIEALADIRVAEGSWSGFQNNVHRLRRVIGQATGERHLLADRPPHTRQDERPRQGRPQRLRNRPPPPDRMAPKFTLFDENKKRIAGSLLADDGKNRFTEIKKDQQLLGWLAEPRRGEITDGFDLQFMQQQRGSRWLISLVVIIASTLIAIPLARHFARPLKQLTATSRQLIAGKLDARIDVKRSDEVGVLASDINQLAETLNDNEQARKRWLADISHELRTPLTILSGEVEALLDGVRPLNMEQVGLLHKELKHMQKLVEDLYQLSSADVGGMRFHKQEFDLVKMLQQKLCQHQPRLDDAGLLLMLDAPEQLITVWADEVRIAQVIDNLLANSLKYTRAPGRVVIALKQRDGDVAFTISDSAPAVPAEALPKLFEHLFRVEGSRSRELGGAGLGLSICQRIIEGHGGVIDAQHSDLGGLAVSFTLLQEE